MRDIRITSPLTVCPQQIIGFVNGRPVRAIAGGAPDDGGDGGQQGEGGGQQGGGDGGQQQGAGDGGQQQGGSDASTNLWDDPAKAKAEIKRLEAEQGRLRNENAKERNNAKAQAAKEARDELLKKLGLTGDGKDAPDPDKLAEQLASRDAEMATMRRERAAEKAARTHNGDVDALMDSRTFLTRLGDLDPDDKKFDTDVDALVKQAITDNPKFKAQARAAGTSGGEFSGGTGEHGKNTRARSLSAAISKELTGSR